MSESSRTSGSFIQPRWKGRPNTFERAASMLMTIAVLAAFLYSAASEFTGRGEVRNAAESVRKSACAISDRLSQPLAATSDGKSGPPAKPPAVRERSSDRPATSLEAGKGRPGWQGWVKSRVHERAWVSWTVTGVMGAIGVLFCFLGWQTKRISSALMGALTLGGAAFALSHDKCSIGLAGSLALALPPAFLGALLAWTCITVVTAIQVGVLLSVPLVFVLIRSATNFEMLPWLAPMAVAVWALVTALTYIFLVRAALISLMSVVGATLLIGAVAEALVQSTGADLPWQAALAMVAFLAILGNVVQYQHAGGGEEEDGGSGDGGDPGAKKPGKLRPKAKPA